jgi:hypothetical protein
MNEMQPEKKVSKIEFISDLLKDKNIGISEKEKLFSLIAKELQNYDDNDVLLFSEIKRIKQHIGLYPNESSEGDKRIESAINNDLPEFINPKGNAIFLKEYNQNVILKSTTHNIDSNLLQSINEYLKTDHYDFNLHLTAIHNEFQNLTNKYFGKTSRGLVPKIKAYLITSKEWSEDKLTLSWGSDDLKHWAESHPGQCPNPDQDISYDGFSFERKKLKNGIYLTNMCDLVLFFKKQVTIRLDNNLYDLCKEWSFNYRDKVDFNFDKLSKNIEFFTDTEKLKQIFKHIIFLCIAVDTSSKPQIELSLSESNDSSMIIFSILHKNSIFGKTPDNTLNRYGNTFTGLINNQINGLCNFGVRANFGNDKYAYLTLWPRTRNYDDIEKIEGVQYELIFNY